MTSPLLARGLVLALALSHTARAQTDLYDTSTVRKIELSFAQSDYWDQMTRNWPQKVFVRATLRFGSIQLNDVGVRFRGNSSYFGIGDSLKKPIEIAVDEFVPTQRLLGYKTINLNNNYVDPSMVREVLGYEIMRKFTPAPKSNYVLLEINGKNWGPYINTQQVNKDFLRENFPSDDGNRYRGERPALATPPNYTAFNWLSSALSEYEKGFELKEAGATPWTDLRDACAALDNSTLAQMTTQLPAVLDVDNALSVLALGNTLLWLDSYVGVACHNFYVYHDEAHGKLNLIPWDLNSCLGSYVDFLSTPIATVSPYYVNTAIGNRRPLLTRMLQHDPWKQRFVAKMRRYKEELRWTTHVRGRVRALQDLIEAHVLADPHRLYTPQSFRGNVTQDVDLGASFLIKSLKSVCEDRYAHLSQHPDLQKIPVQVSELAIEPARPLANQSVRITVRAPYASTVTAFWRVRGAWNELAMFDDGQHADGAAYDGVWGAELPPQGAGTRVEYYVGAATASGIWTGWENYGEGFRRPSYTVAWRQRTSTVLINEFVAKNDFGIVDERGQHEDWVELVNVGAQSVDVGGMYLSDRLENALAWRIPTGTSIPAGGTLLIWTDDDPTDGPLHATFKLSADGEEIVLVDASGSYLLDHIRFGVQAPDVSTGRLFDGGAPLVAFRTPSPRVRNAPDRCGARGYSALDFTTEYVRFALQGEPTLDSTPTLRCTNGPANGVAVVFLAGAPAHIPFLSTGTLLLGPTGTPFFAGVSDASGAADFPLPIPDRVELVGAKIYMQAWSLTTSVYGGNALELTLCPK